mmetsp:Transcript_29655/g.80172  ORF Transcript_29655/g.80172 Transcript_29655/m.80172 type:complete len:270 (+) Transcript_29655:276-1085(+)
MLGDEALGVCDLLSQAAELERAAQVVELHVLQLRFPGDGLDVLEVLPQNPSHLLVFHGDPLPDKLEILPGLPHRLVRAPSQRDQRERRSPLGIGTTLLHAHLDAQARAHRARAAEELAGVPGLLEEGVAVALVEALLELGEARLKLLALRLVACHLHLVLEVDHDQELHGELHAPVCADEQHLDLWLGAGLCLQVRGQQQPALGLHAAEAAQEVRGVDPVVQLWICGQQSADQPCGLDGGLVAHRAQRFSLDDEVLGGLVAAHGADEVE